MHDPQAGKHATRKSAKPAETAATENQVLKRLLSKVLEHPEQFGARQSAQEAGHRSVDSGFRKSAAVQLPPEHPESGERTERHECAKARDFEAADAKQNGVDVYSPGSIMARQPVAFA
jgi:hypothetical protein